jgi:hypothetical protein
LKGSCYPATPVQRLAAMPNAVDPADQAQFLQN